MPPATAATLAPRIPTPQELLWRQQLANMALAPQYQRGGMGGGAAAGAEGMVRRGARGAAQQAQRAAAALTKQLGRRLTSLKKDVGLEIGKGIQLVQYAILFVSAVIDFFGAILGGIPIINLIVSLVQAILWVVQVVVTVIRGFMIVAKAIRLSVENAIERRKQLMLNYFKSTFWRYLLTSAETIPWIQMLPWWTIASVIEWMRRTRFTARLRSVQSDAVALEKSLQQTVKQRIPPLSRLAFLVEQQRKFTAVRRRYITAE